MNAHKPIADPINLYDSLRRESVGFNSAGRPDARKSANLDHNELTAGAAVMEWLAEHLPAMFLGALCGALAVAVPAIVVAWIVR